MLLTSVKHYLNLLSETEHLIIMKKLLFKIALALLPVIMYLAIFIMFEPNNYFGLQQNSSTNSPIARIRAYEAQPYNTIILGDSRMAHFDMQLVSETYDAQVSNVAYGGAGLAESIDEFYYLYEKNPNIENVVFGLSFYTINSAYNPVNRMKTVETQLKNPVAYIFNLEYNVNTITVLTQRISYALRSMPYDDVLATANHTPDEYVDDDGDLLFRQDLIDYAVTLYTNCADGGVNVLPVREYDEENNLTNAREITDYIEQNITSEHSKFSVNEEQLQNLLNMAEFCADNNINLTFVLPPMDESVRKLVCEPLGIDTAMQPVLSALNESGANVLDYEWENSPNYSDTYYYDGFHLDVVHGLPEWTLTLFTEVN